MVVFQGVTGPESSVWIVFVWAFPCCVTSVLQHLLMNIVRLYIVDTFLLCCFVSSTVHEMCVIQTPGDVLLCPQGRMAM